MYDSCYSEKEVLMIEGLCYQHCRGQNVIKRVYIKIYSFRLCCQRSFLVIIFFISWQPLRRFFTSEAFTKLYDRISHSTYDALVLKADVTKPAHVKNRCNFYCVSTIINMFRTQKWDTGPHYFETEFPSQYWFDEWYPQTKHTCLAMSGINKFTVNNNDIIHCNANVKVYVCVENLTMKNAGLLKS